MAKLLIFTFLSILLTTQICSGFLTKRNICKYKKEKSATKNVISKFSRCGRGKRKCHKLLGWISGKLSGSNFPKHDEYYEDCCQGWTNKGPRGCLEKTCIALPQEVPQQKGKHQVCPVERFLNLVEQNIFYKLTTPFSEPLEYINETTNLFEAVSFPLLNQSFANVILRSIFSPTLDEQGWVTRYLGMAQRNRILAGKTIQSENLQPFTKYSDYSQLLESYREEQSKPITSFKIPGLEKTIDSISMAEYMKFPSQELSFKDIIHDEAWQNDDVFTQQRLAGLNTMSLRKMTVEDFNQDFVNKAYDWDAAMERAMGAKTTFSKMINLGKVFILDFKLLHGIDDIEDYTERNTTDRREMRESRSPFCTFVVANVGGVKQLKPVAIQTDLSSEAPVVSPIDGSKWLLAKQEIQRADMTYTEIVEHLLKSHFLMEPICVIMRRTLSFFHPLHQIFKWHCRGLFVTNSLGIQALLQPGQFVHKLFAIGHVGGVELLNKAYPSMSWADTEFDKNLEKRGVASADELPYFPYRDDGLLIWKEIGDFAKEYVRLYYQNDKDVKQDYELANFANQLSADGTGKNGGIGLFKGFPVKIETRSHLIDVVKRIVFIPIQHHTVNYPVAYYGGFVPNLPAKLYDDPRVPPQEFGFDSLPQVHVAAEQVSLSMTLGSLRYDVIFDYGKDLKDDRAKAVVNKYHYRLTGKINAQISARNHKRLANGKLSYPYFLPKWMPNSIQS